MPSSVTAPSQEPTVPIFEPGPDEAPAIVEPPGDGATGPIDDIDDPDAAPASPEPRPGPRNVPREIGSGKGLRSATPGTTASAPVPAAPELPSEPAVTAGPGAIVGQVFGQVVSAAAEQVGRYVRPDAVVAVAGEFTFPLALALAVLVFLVVQDQVDRRDPKLRIAPQNIVETLVQFEGEDQL